MDFQEIQRWYAGKIGKNTDELDDYDNHICKVVKEYEDEAIKSGCKYFIPDSRTSSATRCICGKEQFEHYQ